MSKNIPPKIMNRDMMPAKQISGYLKLARKKSQIRKADARNVKKGMHSLFIRVVCAMIIASFIANSTPAAPRTIYAVAAEFHRDARFIILSGDLAANVAGLANNLLLFLASSAEKQVSQLNRIVIYPGNTTIHQGQPVNFSAVGFSANGTPEGGLKFNWTIQDTGRNLQPRMLANGAFQASIPGTFRVQAEAGGVSAQATIIVVENRVLMTLRQLRAEEVRGILTNVTRLQALGRYRTENISSKRSRLINLPTTNLREIEDSNDDSEEKIPEENPSDKKRSGPSADSTEPPVSSGKRGARSMMRPVDEDGWDDTNWETADDPGNQTGNPPGTSPDSIAGNGNFQFSAPVVALPGRGIDLNLALSYNSRLWSKSGNRMSYDSDKGYPAPGWSLGFGKIVFMGPGGGCMIVDADGTRRSYAGSVSNYTSGNYTSTNHTGHTADGTFINYTCYYSSTPYGKSLSANAKLSNGTTIYYNIATANAEQAFPTRISDAQGNYIDISYRGNRGPEIETIVDTMGRVITFNYDSSNRLISVSVPKMDNAGTRIAVRLHYEQMGLSPGFASPLTADAAEWNPHVINSIYYPGTGTGYWFDDNDSYSSYGMIAKVIEQRGMSWSAGPYDQGTVAPGTMSKQAVYDYPLSANTALTDAPTYEHLTESWAGMDTAAAVTTYSINNNSFHHDGTSNSPSRTVTVTQPNGLISKQYSYRTPGVWTDGLIFSDETIVMNGSTPTVVRSSLNSWQNGVYDSPRPAWTKATDERGQTLKTTYDYGTNYNQVISQKQYDYDGTTLLKETRTTYENSSSYTNATTHIFNLVKSTEIYDGANNRVSKTDYEYDNNAVVNGTANHNLTATPGVTMHYSTYDPYTSDTVNGACLTGQFNYPQCQQEGQIIQIYLPGGGYDDVTCQFECTEYEQVSAYEPNTIFRGNITKTTTFANAATPTGAISQTKKYDATGNLVAESASCCQVKTYAYDDPNTQQIDTQYAYPIKQTRGSSDPNSSIRNTSSAVYDFYTGLIKQTTDANGRSDITTYNVDTLRPTVSTSSTGAYSTSVYDDTIMSIVNETREYGGNLASKNVKYLNGIGKVKREDALGANGILDTAETKYTNSGQIWKKSRPYRSGDTVLWTEVSYDLLGRTLQVAEPDGSISEVFYNETSRPSSASSLPGNTVRSRDAWGRERWTRKDALERQVEVIEPNPTGDGAFSATGNLATNYTYDTLGQVTQTNQGGQLRKFRYDSLGRMTLQKLAEQSATINDAGQFVGEGASGASWSGAVFYDDRSNIIQKVDSRGVTINYSYQISGSDDPLNRLQRVSTVVRPENNPQLPNVVLPIHNTPDVTYEYMTTGDQHRIKKIRTAGVLTEDFTYDGEARVQEITKTVDSRTNYPWVTTYSYDTLGRVTGIWYPAQYGPSGGSRKLIQNTYDVASRLTTLKIDGQDAASDIVYNASDQTTSIKIGTSGTNQITENYTFDSQTGLLANQQAIKTGSALLDLSYDYARNNSAGNTNVNWKTGALTKITNNLDRNKDRQYEYDALGRLTKAVGGINQTWTHQYVYDRYGNRTNVNAFGMESLRPTASQADVKDTPQSSREQNAGEAEFSAKNMLPTADEFLGNADSYAKSGRGPSADSTDLTRELPSGDDKKAEVQKDDEAEIAEEKISEDKTASSDEGTKSPSTTKVTKEKSEPAATSAASALLLPPPSRPGFDFDGDNKADVSTWNRTNGTWTIRRSQSGQTTTTQLGGSGNQIAPGDYDGDGKTDEAVWNPSTGVWTIKQSLSGTTVTQQWGASGDTVVPADYDGDGKTDVAVWRPSTGVYYILRSSNGTWYYVQFGGIQYGDIPTLGDFDGDNKADICVWRPSNGVWYILQSSNGQVIYPQWGASGDVPVAADYDADNKTDLAVWRPSTGYWYVSKSSNGQVLQAQLGSESARDVLVPADYDNDQQADMAVWTPSTGTWTIRQSTTGTNATQQLGASGQLAVPSAYIRRSSAPRNQNVEIERDGHAALSYNTQTNRITTAGFEYDAAGNQTRALAEDGTTGLKFEYDAANRLQIVKRDDANQTLVQTFQYGSSNARLIEYNAGTGLNTFYVSAGGKTFVEFTEYAQNVQTWTKSYVYLGDRLLSTITPNGSSGESREYHHPDRLGTRLITNQAVGTSYEQTHLPFGTALNTESTITGNNRRFTSYDRSAATGLDYAQNRTYDSKQGRFTQVDPIGMSAASLSNPQSLNLYNYVGNDPINRTDPTGLFWGAIGRFFRALFRVLAFVALIVAVVVLAVTGVGLIVAGGIVGKVIGAVFLIGAIFLAAKVGATIYSGVKEFLNKCNAPDFAGLSRARQDELAQRGVSPEQWNNLKNKQRLGYFNITAAIASAGLSLLGWLVDWAAGGIQQDRTFFIQGQGATNLLAQVMSSRLFSLDIFSGASYRLNTLTRSTELTFSSNGRRLEVDIDFFNPNKIPFGLIGHGFEVISHALGGIFGGTRTNPYNVAYRSSWECK